MPRQDLEAQKLVSEYAPLQGKYQSFSELIGGIVGRLAKKVGRKYQMVGCRAKDKDALYEKILRKRRVEKKDYKSLSEIEDLAGARIIFYLESDRRAFIQDLHNELGEKSILSTQEQIKANGYRATHMILSLDETRTGLPEYAEFKGLKCELQITSALYHTWSEVEHDITYKPDGDREKLLELGLDRLEGKFQELHKHIQGAAIQLDLIHEDYEQIRKFGSLLDSNLVNEVSGSSNDKILEILGLMEGFTHKKPDETYAVIELVFAKKPSEPEVLGILGDREIKGKTHEAVEAEALKLLAHIRYYKPEETLKLLAKLILQKDGSVKEEVRKVLGKFAEYNYHYIKKAKNYQPQFLALDYILKWTFPERLKNFDFIETVCKEILGSDVEGSDWTNEETLTYHFGAVSATDGLKSLRTRTIDLLDRLFHRTTKTEVKLRILKILEEASRTPTHVVDEEVKAMIIKDADHILRVYKKMVLSADKRRLIGPLSVIEEIESRLYWWPKWNLGGTEVVEFRDRLLNDRFYGIARLLVGNSRIYQAEEMEDKAVGRHDTSVEDLLKTVTRASINQWEIDLNKIAGERTFIDEWQYMTFRSFIGRLSAEKPNLGDLLLSRAVRAKAPLAFYADAFIEGFRNAGRVDLWDKYAGIAVRDKDVGLTKAIVRALYVTDQKDPKISIRDEDVGRLVDIVQRRNNFSFLAANKDFHFHITLFQVLTYALRKAPKRIEPLIREQIKSNPEMFGYFVDSIGTAVHLKNIDVQTLSPATKTLLAKELVKVRSLEWRGQDLLLQLGKNDLNLILDVFVARIRSEEKKKKDQHVLDNIGDRYDAVPYNINPELAEFVGKHPDLPDKALEMLGKMTKQWSLYNWDVTHFFERIGSPGFMSIVELAIKKGGERNILNAAHCLSTTNNADIDTCMQVIGKSGNKRVAGLIDQAILSTGMVSGHYGLADAYQAKADALKPYTRSRNQRIKDYAKKTVDSLEKTATRARRDADEEIAARKLRFELSQ